MASTMKFDPEHVLGSKITEKSPQELCALASGICAAVIDRTAGNEYRGGIYPENISVDENGAVALGPVSDGEWKSEELSFMAPEFFWNGKPGSSSDVYSIGMLLYYAVTGGKLPFDGNDSGEDAQARRTGGEELVIPETVGKPLGKIISKATAFDSSERYSNVVKLTAALDACIDGCEPEDDCADDPLGEMAVTMAAILGDSTPDAEDEAEDDPSDVINVVLFRNGDNEAAPEAVEDEEVGSRSEEPEESSEPEESDRSEESDEPMIVTLNDRSEQSDEPVESDEPEESAEPVEPSEAVESVEAEEPSEPAVIELKEEPNPELQPIVVAKPPVPPVQYIHAAEREKKIAEKVRRRRRRPVIFILAVCAILVITALIYGGITNDVPRTTPAPIVTPTPSAVIEPIVTAPVEPTQPVEPVVIEHTYQLFVEDVSWEKAAERCREMGGYLVTIDTEDEFKRIVTLAQNSEIGMVWVGGRRIDGAIVWESGDTVEYYKWDFGEPSYRDSYDGAEEDCILLWDHNGWFYNDSRNDPIADYPTAYRGKLAYVCEFEG